ncbi:hypothetical protein ACFE04_015665 [Oxalis oulophora]
MDRKSWLWRRKSSEKSPAGETESSGSLSSLSERFSDDQAFATHSSQSPESSSKPIHIDEQQINHRVKTLTEKLSAALLNISAKEDLVNQHSKVAEEAISGWEKAGKEASALKQQLEIAIRKNSSLEDRIGHLDGALKECVRQLRQGREDQEQKVREEISKKTSEWESIKYEFESQLADLQAQLQIAEARSVPVHSEIHQKLEALEKENSALKLEILDKAEEIEIQIVERELSNRAAETISKQHLESRKKTAKLEAEIRRLKAGARKSASANYQNCFTASSTYVESFTDSQSDSVSVLSTDFDQVKNERASEIKLVGPSTDNIMDDFLEMERFAAFPGACNASYTVAGPIFEQRNSGESSIRAELSAMINKTSDLEQKLDVSNRQLNEAEKKYAELQTQLVMRNQLEQDVQAELKAISLKRLEAESSRGLAEAQNKTLRFKIASLEDDVKKGRALLAENEAKRQKLEIELSEKKHEVENQREAELKRLADDNNELNVMQDKELAVAASKFAECQKTIASIGQQLKSLATLEDFLLDNENPLNVNAEETCQDGQPLSLQSDDLYLSNKKTKSFKILSERLKFSKKGNERVPSPLPTDPHKPKWSRRREVLLSK